MCVYVCMYAFGGCVLRNTLRVMYPLESTAVRSKPKVLII